MRSSIGSICIKGGAQLYTVKTALLREFGIEAAGGVC